jgi:hypothetical protein
MNPRTLLAVLPLLVTTAVGAQAPVSGVFVSTLGNDTIAVERYTRNGSRLEGEVLTRNPRVQIVRYVADLGNGKFRGMSVSTRSGDAEPNAAPLFSMITLIGDSTASIEVQRGGRPDTANTTRRTFRGRVAPSIPGLPSAVGLYEQILAFNQPTGRDSLRLSMLGAGNPATLSLLRRSRDTIVMVSSFNPGWIEVATVDAGGRVTALDATATTVKTRTHRASALDFDATVKAWTALEAARGRAGRMSPLDSVKTTLGTATVEIVYSRPFKRGRQIWGDVVPWGRPWRTGANAATQLTTSADIIIGATIVPAGKYTLWSLPSATGTQLIINTQTGQWGTIYDPSKDLVRVAMTQGTTGRVIEQFTISIAPQGNAAVLRMAWDDREFSVPFVVRKTDPGHIR